MGEKEEGVSKIQLGGVGNGKEIKEETPNRVCESEERGNSRTLGKERGRLIE